MRYTLYELVWDDCYKLSPLKVFDKLSDIMNYVEGNEDLFFIQAKNEVPTPFCQWRDFYYNAYKKDYEQTN